METIKDDHKLKLSILGRIKETFLESLTNRAILKRTINSMEAEKQTLERHYEDVNSLNVELNKKMKQLIATQEAAKAILSELNLEKLLSMIMNILNDVCKINRAVIMLRNEKSGFLEYIYGMDLRGELPEQIKQYKVPLRRVNNILVRVSNTGITEYVSDIKRSALRKENLLLTHANPTSVYIHPLITRAKVIGIIATDSVEAEGVPEETRVMIGVFAPQIAIALENARLYGALQGQMFEIQKSRAMLSRADKFSFLSRLSEKLAHEIRDPISSIGTFIGMLPDRFYDEEFRDSFYKRAMEETNRVNNLISELLDLVRSKEPEFKLIDLHDLIDKVILLVSPHSNAKKVKINCLCDPDITYVWMDPEKIKQAILNILSNAVEFTPENGKIQISTENLVNPEKKQYIRIRIKDNGIGISEHLIEKIFDPYFSIKRGDDRQYSSGLGLFIAHQIIQEHQGTITVKSKENEGTVFILNIPVNPPEYFEITQKESG
ncbi:ATP-binding protein [Thermodesulfobacteriota bacterium]